MVNALRFSARRRARLHEPHAAEGSDVIERIALRRDEVGFKAGRDGAEVAVPRPIDLADSDVALTSASKWRLARVTRSSELFKVAATGDRVGPEHNLHLALARAAKRVDVIQRDALLENHDVGSAR